MGVLAAGALAVCAPRSASPEILLPWLACIALAMGATGLAAGSARLDAIDRGALDLPAGERVVAGGFVVATPTRDGPTLGVEVETPEGRVLVEFRGPAPELSVGTAIRVRGAIRDPGDWERTRLARLGIRDVLAAVELERRHGRRDGVVGMLDRVRARAERALGEGTTPAAASLLRGFVLGQDDRIEEATVERFKRSGLAHLLAVSGQNIVLLAVLTGAVLALLGVPLRMRLLWILVLIAIYVPVAGAGASIQRAGVMGAAGVFAALAGRPSSRWYAVALAAGATLVINPRASADVGWQLSFAAVIGILVATRPLVRVIAPRATGWRRALAQGAAITVAATLATAPLMSHHFGSVSVVALPANLVAMPAVAPVMWLGMLIAALGQLPWLPLEPLTWLAGTIAGFIAQVAHWSGAPAWSQLEIALEDPLALASAYALTATAGALILRWIPRRAGLRPATPGPRTQLEPRSARRRAVAAALGIAALSAAVALGLAGPSGSSPTPGLRITALDVGQGDSILLEPRGGDPVLIDAGHAAAGVATMLDQRGIERLSALIVTHPDDDHDGGAEAVLAEIPTRRLIFARARPATVQAARATGTRPLRVADGARLRSAGLRLEVLWPPSQLLDPTSAGDRAVSAAAEPNLLSLVVLARWRRFEALLTGDAEAEAAPVDPGAVELLKIAHHGSEDAGLDRLLELTEPSLALISVGAANPYGHPSPATLGALASHEIPTVRTDREGEIAIEVERGTWNVVE